MNTGEDKQLSLLGMAKSHEPAQNIYYEGVGQCIFDIFRKEAIGEMVKDLQGRTAPDICQKFF